MDTASLLIWIFIILFLVIPVPIALISMAWVRWKWAGIARRNRLRHLPRFDEPCLIGTDPYGFLVEVVITRDAIIKLSHQAKLPRLFQLRARGRSQGGGTGNLVLDMMVRASNAADLPWEDEDLMAGVLEFVSNYPDALITHRTIEIRVSRSRPQLARHLHQMRKLARTLKRATQPEPLNSAEEDYSSTSTVRSADTIASPTVADIERG